MSLSKLINKSNQSKITITFLGGGPEAQHKPFLPFIDKVSLERRVIGLNNFRDIQMDGTIPQRLYNVTNIDHSDRSTYNQVQGFFGGVVLFFQIFKQLSNRQWRNDTQVAKNLMELAGSEPRNMEIKEEFKSNKLMKQTDNMGRDNKLQRMGSHIYIDFEKSPDAYDTWQYGPRSTNNNEGWFWKIINETQLKNDQLDMQSSRNKRDLFPSKPSEAQIFDSKYK